MTEPATIDPASLSMAGIRAGLLRDRPVTVLGFARSGIALARFLTDAGARVSIYDGRPASELGRAIEGIASRAVTLALGPDVDPSSVLDGAALVATSPAINPDYPTTEPRLRAALRSMVERRASGDRTAPALIAEADLFLRLCPAPTIGVTGTKGKTTTSSLIAAVLATDAAHPAILGGNIGIPLVERLWELTPDHRVVIELSELQLPTLSRGTNVAVYTNVTSDHLDRHGSLEAYRTVKRRLAELVDPAGTVVLNADDPIVAGYAAALAVPVIRYGHDAPSVDVGIADGWVVAAGERILPVTEIPLPGRHSWSNVLAAVAVGLHFGIHAAAIRSAVAAFAGVEHRLEAVATVDGVRFVNDSQGTQPDAVIAALRAFEAPVVLIAGGRDKDVDLSDLVPVVAERAHAVVLIGESGPALERLFREAGLTRTERAATLEAAVDRADAIAREALQGGEGGPATVLLSPAAASFDMFEDYAARGRAFKAAVARLRETREQEGSR